jgi:hypothetical protein
MATQPDGEPIAMLVTRLTDLEHLVRTQQAEIALLRARDPHHRVAIASEVMEVGHPMPPSEAAPALAAAPASNQSAEAASQRASRRALLKLGGAAAAASVAAIAVGASDLAHPGDAEATAIPWTTTTFTTNAQTWVGPFDPTYADPTMLTVQIGGGTLYGQLSGANQAALAGYDRTDLARTGVYGTSPSGIGVEGRSDSGWGLYGKANNGNGVGGIASNGYGVTGKSIAGVGGSFGGGSAPLYLVPSSSAGAPVSGTHNVGEIYVDILGVLWSCLGGGTPGTWVRLTGVSSTAAGGAITYLSTPVRLLDARTSASSGLVNRGALAGNEIFTFAVAGLGGIPANAQGLIGNVTVLGPSSAGNLSLFPAGGAIPTVASMTFGTAGLFLANGVNVAIGSGGAINIQNQSGGTTPLVLDAVAYVS